MYMCIYIHVYVSTYGNICVNLYYVYIYFWCHAWSLARIRRFFWRRSTSRKKMSRTESNPK